MAKNRLEDLRDHLFVQLERLKDDMTPEQLAAEIDRAKAVSEVAARVVDSAKVEVAYLSLNGGLAMTSFFQKADPPRLTNGTKQ